MSNYAPIRHDIWRNPEFGALTPDAKLLYLLLITHQKLTRCGALDLMPSRWAKVTGLPPEAVSAALVDLAAAQFVIVDEATEEVAVRSKVKHDKPGTWTQVKAVWRAWETVESPFIRAWLAFSFPDECWREEKAPAPIGRPFEAPSDGVWHGVSDGVSAGGSDSPARAIAPRTVHSSPLTYAHPLERSVTYEGDADSEPVVDNVARVQALKDAKKREAS